MKLLLDENLPIKLKYRFKENDIEAQTVKDMLWLGRENGDLLNAMIENNFTAFITIDNNLSFQNNFTGYPIAVIVLVAHDNTYETIMEFFEEILDAVRENFTGPKTVVHKDYTNS
jgi:predicted nuclease of predicted toxin-antitoxin system